MGGRTACAVGFHIVGRCRGSAVASCAAIGLASSRVKVQKLDTRESESVTDVTIT